VAFLGKRPAPVGSSPSGLWAPRTGFWTRVGQGPRRRPRASQCRSSGSSTTRSLQVESLCLRIMVRRIKADRLGLEARSRSPLGRSNSPRSARPGADQCLVCCDGRNSRQAGPFPATTVPWSAAPEASPRRCALALDHERNERLQWVSAHRLLWWALGHAEAARPVTSSALAFSRRDTKAARAIRSRLQAMGVPVSKPRSLPKHRRPGEVPYRVLRA
jgi:hypothetical protein